MLIICGFLYYDKMIYRLFTFMDACMKNSKHTVNCILAFSLCALCSISSYAATDPVIASRSAYASELNTIKPTINAVLDHLQNKFKTCDDFARKEVDIMGHPYFNRLVIDELCTLILVANDQATYSTRDVPAVYRFWPICKPIGSTTKLVGWRVVTNADLNMASFVSLPQNTNQLFAVYSRLANEFEYPFYQMEYHAQPYLDAALPFSYENACVSPSWIESPESMSSLSPEQASINALPSGEGGIDTAPLVTKNENIQKKQSVEGS